LTRRILSFFLADARSAWKTYRIAIQRSHAFFGKAVGHLSRHLIQLQIGRDVARPIRLNNSFFSKKLFIFKHKLILMKKIFASFFILVSSSIYSQAPTFQWAKGMGGPNNDCGSSIVLDGSGNVYTTGYFSGTVDFDPGAGTFTLSSGLGNDVFISKLDALGNFIWAKNLGGSGFDNGNSIVLDGLGNVYTTGFFSGTADFDPGAGTFNLTSAGDRDIFISKLDASGNFIWAKSMGGAGRDYGNSIALDGSGNVYTTGFFFGGPADFDPGAGIFNLTSAGNMDIFISKLDASGNFIWAKNLGDVSDDEGTSIAIDGLGNVYTTGFFGGTVDFDPGAGIFNLSSVGSWDIFISKLDSSGNFIWATSMGGAASDQGLSILLDGSANVYTTGYYVGTADFDPGAGVFNLTCVGFEDIFISKLDSSGNFIWAKSMGGSGTDQGFSIVLDGSDNIYTTGLFQGTSDFDPGATVFNLTSGGTEDIFISKLDSSGNFIWAESIGGAGSDGGYSIALDGPTIIYTTGAFGLTTDFDPGAGTFNLTSAGSGDVFVLKLSASPTGIEAEENNMNAFNIFPNPNNGKFDINFILNNSAQVKYQMTDVLGKTIYVSPTQAFSSGKNKIQVDLDFVPAGIYFIQVNFEKGISTYKIIIQ
jgi:hypothetical protein